MDIITMQPYKTVARTGESEIVIQKSRFFGYCQPVNGEDDAMAALSNVRAMHREASHNCYAYIVGENGMTARYSDDGEPGGTAGLPMMQVLKTTMLRSVLLVVTRYFGGILLGANGLVRAYSKTASQAISAAGVRDMIPSRNVSLELDYALWGKLENKLRQLPCKIEDPQFGEKVSVAMCFRQNDTERCIEQIVQLSDGRLRPVLGETIYLAWE